MDRRVARLHLNANKRRIKYASRELTRMYDCRIVAIAVKFHKSLISPMTRVIYACVTTAYCVPPHTIRKSTQRVMYLVVKCVEYD